MKLKQVGKVLAFVVLMVPVSVIAQEMDAKTYTQKGMSEFEVRDYKEALLFFNKAIEKDSSYHIAWYMRGNTKGTFEDLHGAMQDYNRAIDINPKFYEAYYERGNVKFRLQDYYGAISDFTKTIELNENHVEAYYMRGKAKHEVEAYQDAINDCTKILEINSKNVDAYYLRGILRVEHGQLELGCLDLSKAGELGDLKAYEVIRQRCNTRRFSQDDEGGK